MPASASDALQEAYASNPADQYVIRGVELIHPSFTDGEDPPSADSLRAVLDDRDWTLPHEAGAPIFGGQSVLYEKLALRATLPGQEETGFGELKLALDNVPRRYLKDIETASTQYATALLIYREWVATQDPETKAFTLPDEPDLVVGQLSVRRVTVRQTTIECTATFIDLLRKGFPVRVFDRDTWPGLFA